MESWRRIDKLTKTSDRQAAFVADPEHYQFRIACSCPPSLQLYMRGGLMYQYRDSGDGWYVDSTTFDLTAGVDGAYADKTYTFTGAGNYLGYMLLLADGGEGGSELFIVAGDDTEVATAAEAEQSVIDYTFAVHRWGVHYPLCGLILRNDGTLGTGYNILPIDTVNRGRSYIWPRDLRPRNIAPI